MVKIPPLLGFKKGMAMAEQDRRRVLAGLGARGRTLEELLEFNRSKVDPERCPSAPAFPLADEPQLEAWRRYHARSVAEGAWPVLAATFPQLMFPVREGQSEAPEYRDATRKGRFPEAPQPPELADPAAIELELHPSIAGTVPVLSVRERADFETLVRAFTARGEPVAVPPSMGACLVAGLNDWARIHTHRAAWEAAGGGDWAAEMCRLTADTARYQDRFVLLSRGPYSDVPAAATGLDEPTWFDRSYALRRGHECTHYFTLRVFGGLQHNVLEELLADLAGLLAAFGTYDPELALRVLGLEDGDRFRPGGRLANYRGTLSDDAFAVLQRLTRVTVAALARRTADLHGDPAALASLLWRLTPLPLEDLAAGW